MSTRVYLAFESSSSVPVIEIFRVPDGIFAEKSGSAHSVQGVEMPEIVQRRAVHSVFRPPEVRKKKRCGPTD